MSLKAFSGGCEIRRNDTFGNYIVTTKPFRAGEIILKEEPAVIVPQWDEETFCSNCFKKSETTCTQCKIFPLCLNCSKHDNFDCTFFQNLEIDKNFFLKNFSTYGPIKCLLLMENPWINTEIWENFISLESHLIKRRNTNIWKEHEKNVIEPIIKSGLHKQFKKDNVNEDFLQKICAIIDINSYEIRGPEGLSLRGVFTNASLIVHNCTPNTFITVDETFNMKIYAAMDLKENDIVFINYTNPLLGTKERQTHLKIGKYFECQCERCNDPTEFGTFLSGIICKSCDDGLILYHHIIDTWKCNKCSKITENSDIQKILSEVNEKIQESGNDLTRLEYLLQKYEKLLNPSHFLIFDIKQNIASILRTICINSITKPGLLVIKRKIQLCEEILQILRKLQPNRISRLIAIALYEYYTPLYDFLQRQYDNSEIKREEFLKKLKNCEIILKQSTEMLLYEPLRTPEGELSRRSLMELKELRTTIKDIEAEEQEEK